MRGAFTAGVENEEKLSFEIEALIFIFVEYRVALSGTDMSALRDVSVKRSI